MMTVTDLSATVQKPLVSVVLVTFNRANSLERVLRCLSRQSLKQFECWIMDDASTDATREVASCHSKVDTRFIYQRQAYNKGMPGNLNDGLRRCQADFIAILHDDDYFTNELLERWHRALVKHPTAGFVFNSYLQAVPRRIDPMPPLALPAFFPGSDLLDIFLKRWMFASPVWGSAMVRADALAVVGYPSERFGFYADVDLWMRLARKYDVCYLSDVSITLSDQGSLFSRPIWPTEWLIQTMFRELRMERYADSRLRLAMELGKHFTFRCCKAAYWTIILLKKGFFKEAPGALRYALGAPAPQWHSAENWRRCDLKK